MTGRLSRHFGPGAGPAPPVRQVRLGLGAFPGGRPAWERAGTRFVAAAAGPRERAAAAVPAAFEPDLGDDRELTRAVATACRELGG